MRLSNGAFFPVNGVLASDADKDLAIIKVSGKNLPFLTLGDIDKLRVGDHVVAIGSPLGLEGTVSDGIVSAFRDGDHEKWIQTTAPVSHGNSGGPLLDMNDQVVGVITWGVHEGQNLNFAAPCSEVKTLLANANEHAKPLDSVVGKSEGTSTEGTVWTSTTSPQQYSIRQDGDYLYIDWINIPPNIKAAGGFVKQELEKNLDGKWRGKVHGRVPCTYTRHAQNVTNWCRRDSDVEIDLLSDKRIEGIGTSSEKFDCEKCEAKGRLVQHPFTFVPK